MAETSEFRRWLTALSVMFVTVVEVLDMTIVNVALPTMMGSLSANTEEITWVLTSYIVAAAIFMPLTGFLINRLGVKKLLLINIVGFLASSMLCGLSTSLSEIVIFRTFQGVFGASLVPISQFVLRDTFPPEQMTKAMAIWGVGIMAGPVLGPTLGGYITDTFNWRWIFYINIPVCVAAFFLCMNLIKETAIKANQTTDWLGIVLMATTVGCLQMFLDRGNTDDWFSANSIRWLFIIFILSLIIFIIRGLKTPTNIINLKLFANRNFGLGCGMLAIFCSCMFGMLAIQPLLMENYMNYPTDLAGLVMAPRGIASAIAMGSVPMLIKYFDVRRIIAFGLCLCALGTYGMAQFTLDISPMPFIITGAVQGFGMGLFFVPISNLAFVTLAPGNYAEASGLFSFWRSIGQSIGISILSTLLTRESQTNWNVLNGHINLFNPNLFYWLAKQQTTITDPATLQNLSNQLSQQAGIISFVDAFHLVTYGFILLIPLVFFMKKPAQQTVSLSEGH